MTSDAQSRGAGTGPGRRRVYLIAGLVLGAIVLSGCSAGSAEPTSGAATVEAVGFSTNPDQIVLLDVNDRRPVPELVGSTIYDSDFDLSDYAGKVVVLNIWASWCVPCREEAEDLLAVWDDYRTSGTGKTNLDSGSPAPQEVLGDEVQFVGLVTRDSQVASQRFAEKYGLDYPHLMDADGSLQLLLRDSVPAQAIPSTLVIDKNGLVAGRAIGKVSESSLRGLIEPLLVEKPGTPPSGSRSTGP